MPSWSRSQLAACSEISAPTNADAPVGISRPHEVGDPVEGLSKDAGDGLNARARRKLSRAARQAKAPPAGMGKAAGLLHALLALVVSKTAPDNIAVFGLDAFRDPALALAFASLSVALAPFTILDC